MTWSEEHPDIPEPKYYTRRNPSRRTRGGRVAKIGAALGKPPMPWQRYVMDVANEVDEHGNLVYEIVLVTVPRQSGKTTLVGPVQIERVMMTPGIKSFYTAQTGKDARSRFNDLVNLVQASPLAAVAKIRYSAGDEGIKFPNGSAYKLFAPVAAALHGETPPLVTLDEIWEFDEALGDALLEGAILPAQMTLAGRRQVWMISTAGTALSTFMRKWVERGRKGYPRMAYFEWSLPDGADPYDPVALASFHPAIGHTVTAADLLALAGRDEHGQLIDPDVEGMSHANWLRGFCNIWTDAADPVMSAEDWAALRFDDMLVPSRRDVVVSFDVDLDNASASVLASWRESDGRAMQRTIHTAPGTTWLRPFLRHLVADWQPAAVAADDGGPARRVIDELERDGLIITRTAGRDFATACDSWLTAAIADKTLAHDGSRTLSNAVAHLAIVDRGDSRYVSRSRSTGPVAGVVAAIVGLWVYDHREAPMPAPFIYA